MIKLEDVKMVYSGKPGCMCGCRGNYRYPSTVTVEQTIKVRGYKTDDDASGRSINDRQVKKVVQFLNDAMSDPKTRDAVEQTNDSVYVELAGRAYCAYFND